MLFQSVGAAYEKKHSFIQAYNRAKKNRPEDGFVIKKLIKRIIVLRTEMLFLHL
jgi:hypothetical protein